MKAIGLKVLGVVLAVGSFLSMAYGYSGGDGSAGNPYQIASKADLLALGADTDNYNKCFILTANIDLTGEVFSQAVIAPDLDNINIYEFNGTAFTGIFDGNGHVVSHLTIHAADTDFIGLFGYLGENGKIRNLGLEDVDVLGRACVGGLVGGDYYGTITTCYMSGVINGSDNAVGGLVGWNVNSTITSCYATGAVSGSGCIGGLVGQNDYGTIATSYATGAVNGTDYHIGGLVGVGSYGTITSCYATGAVSGGYYVGGLVGGNYQGKVIRCYSAGKPTGISDVGGLCGYKYTGSGYEDTGNFWDTETSEMAVSAMGTGKTTAQMQEKQTFVIAGWDFIAPPEDTLGNWFMLSGGYPRLGWEIYPMVLVPDLRGQTLAQGESELSRLGICFGGSYYVYDISLPVGQISRTSPVAGELVYKGLAPVNILLANTTKYSGGSGTSVDPYQIANVADWQELMADSGNWDKCFILTADIDLAGFVLTPIAPDTDPLSYFFQGTYFSGIFDGQRHVLHHVTINRPSEDYVGLFGGVSGQIKNLGLDDVEIVGRYWVGGLAGMGGTTSNCYTTGQVTGNNDVGGLAGVGYTTTSCYSCCAVTGSMSVGGLLGSGRTTTSSCYATGSVSGTNKVGGLVGNNYQGKVIHCYATGKPMGSMNVGGLCGSMTMGGDYEDAGNFWDTQTSETVVSAMGTGKTTAQMKSLATFTSAWWDFLSVPGDYTGDWIMPSDGYPRLACEVYPVVVVPDLRGKTESEARAALMAAGILAGDSYNFYDTTLMAGLVSRTYPASGLSVYAGITPVHLFLASTTKYSGGSGTEAQPYQISNVADWLTLIAANADNNKQFVLTADLDFGGYPLTPVGASSYYFGGVFEGKNHVLRNVTIQQPDNDCVGLFGCLSSPKGEVRGLGVENVRISGNNYVGGLAGGSVNGRVILCYTTGIVNGYWQVGGLVGSNSGNVDSCYASVMVTSPNDQVGGLLGWNSGNYVICSYATGDVKGHGDVGGLIGQSGSGYIASCYATGKVIGTGNVGGLVGSMSQGHAYFSFWDIQTSGQTWSAGGEGKTTVEMQTQSTFAEWDFVDVWRMCGDGVDYPRLRWDYEWRGDWECPNGTAVEDLAYFSEQWLETGWCNLADRNTDGQVNLLDFVTLTPEDLAGFVGSWLQTGCEDLTAADGDINGDNIVNLEDFCILAAHWLEGV